MGMGAVGVAGLLAACGGDSDSDASGGAPADSAEPSSPSTPSEPAQTPSTPAETLSTPPAEPPAAEALTTTAEVPVGGGVILDGAGVVVTQPATGQFVAFSSTCTHQGCAVTEVADGLITCTCHGSQYSVADGSVQQGPAEQPLEPVAIVVQGDEIFAS
ncbi:Rieske (2Fe-2S) protein [Jiangella asiatica]|uniref:Cytochrome bc1 complex Rieske iron-sulfur subunit n=2 Tax=Jiangella asiatica TaxID=2530372 RepID=A0A4R5D7V1_9ACTN|nr:Rieske (2Fe-2S) protein [Jiangella asiatica]